MFVWISNCFFLRVRAGTASICSDKLDIEEEQKKTRSKSNRRHANQDDGCETYIYMYNILTDLLSCHIIKLIVAYICAFILNRF